MSRRHRPSSSNRLAQRHRRSHRQTAGAAVDRTIAASAKASDSRLPGWLVPVITGLVLLAPFAPLLWPDDRVIPDNDFCDYGSFQLPIREFARQEFLSGRFPLWIPYLGCGTPLHAGQQASLCQPILTPLVIALGANAGIKASLFIHLALAFAGVYRLARDLSTSPWGASLAGTIVTWGAFPVMHLMAGHVIIVDEYAMVPWLFAALNRLLSRPTARHAAFLSVPIGMMAVSGQPQIFYYALLFAFLWTLGSLAYGAAGAARLRCLGWGTVASACGVLLGGAQLLPALELTLGGISQSERGTFDYASQYALNAIDLARLVVPGAMGNPFCGLPRLDEMDFVHERVGYVGLLPLALAVYGLTRRSCARWQWGVAGMVLLGLAAALGKNSPLFDPLASFVPGLSLFRCPGRVFSVLTVLIALLAGRGLDDWAAAAPRGRWPAWLGLTAGALAVVAQAAFGSRAVAASHDWSDYVAYARRHLAGELAGSALSIMIAVIVIFALPKRLPLACCCLAAICATLLDLGDQTIGNFSLEPRQSFLTLPLADGRGEGDDRAYGSPPERSASNAALVRFVDHANFQFWPQALTTTRTVPFAINERLPTIATNEGGVLPGSLSRLYRALEKRPSVALALASCNYACSRAGGLWGQLPGALPRIRLVRAADRALVFKAIEEVTSADLETLRDGLAGRVNTVHEDAQNLTLNVSTPEDCVLVVADLFYPAWQCSIDGRAAAIEAANGVFRAVAVNKGKHRVSFRYRSAFGRWGAICSVLGFTGAALMIGCAQTKIAAKWQAPWR